MLNYKKWTKQRKNKQRTLDLTITKYCHIVMADHKKHI